MAATGCICPCQVKLQMGILSGNESYRKMVRFRNFLVHCYKQIDVEILVDMVNRRLPDWHFNRIPPLL